MISISGKNEVRVYATKRRIVTFKYQFPYFNASQFILEHYGPEELAEGDGRRSICPPDERRGPDMRRKEVQREVEVVNGWGQATIYDDL
ncbi:hypothetical protein I312_103697 [Cryptococcus bacillisporus CA1280]|uniref:uncharacterized protein n=1 Tax=Cryptococcus bacillisporus CA1280 TaxID=1296109 RepID=UPI0033692A91